MRLTLDRLQPLGRALMLPIAVLPAAGLLLRFGQPDLLDLAFVAAAGNAIFAHLGLLFAIGVAVGLARESHGAAGLAGAVCYLVTTEGAKALMAVPPDALAGLDGPARDLAAAAWKAAAIGKLSVPAGIVAGLIAGAAYNRFGAIRLPEYLAFFGGRRFVPIASGFAGLVTALLFGLGFPVLDAGIDALSRQVVASGGVGLFLFGFLNRILIVTGLHHILNNIAWFIIGDFNGATGDLKRFFAGDPSAGAFMSGFFPVMMFGLPAACLAMYRSALPERRAAVGGMLLSLALTAFLTGITEPIEFTFMFLAPVLYLLHAAMTGAAMVIMDGLGAKLGFGFSAGLLDYLLNLDRATRPLLLLPVGAAYFLLYYAVFRIAIVRLDLRTPGRDPAVEPMQGVVSASDRARAFVTALGGSANLSSVAACATRLRLDLVDPTLADEARLAQLGSRGVVRVGAHGVQVVVGGIADQVASEIEAVWKGGGAGAPAAPTRAEAATPLLDDGLVAVFGGRDNIRSSERRSTRLLVDVLDRDAVDLPALGRLATRGFVESAAGRYQLVAPG